MDPISKFVQSLQKRPNIQGTILRFPAPFLLIGFFLILIRSILVYNFVQRSIQGGVCYAFTLQNHQILSSTKPRPLGRGN